MAVQRVRRATLGSEDSSNGLTLTPACLESAALDTSSAQRSPRRCGLYARWLVAIQAIRCAM